MQRSWSLREEITSASQRWPVILAFILVGALLGAIVAWLVPAPYQAIEDLYVGLDVYRAMRDMNIPVRVEGANDYKNWQMEDLKLVITSQPVINETIKHLRQQDGYWNNVNKKFLTGMLQVYWRSAGRWRLVATHPDIKYARQAVETWRDIALSEVHAAVAASQEVMVLDTTIQANVAQIAELTSQEALLTQALNELDTISDRIEAARAESSGNADTPSSYGPDQIRQEIMTLVQASGLIESDSELWSSFPAETSSVTSGDQNPNSQTLQDFDKYQEWITELILVVEKKASTTQAQIDQLNTDLIELQERYANAASASWGLSANLVVENQDDFAPEVKKVRPVAQIMLIGALLGLLIWLIFELVLITLRSRRVSPTEEAVLQKKRRLDHPSEETRA